MTTRFLDSFDHYTTVTDKWTSVEATPSISAGNGRYSTAGLQLDSNDAVLKTLSNQSRWTVGFAWRRTGTPFAGSILELRDGASLQCEVRSVADGTMTITRNTTVLGTTSYSTPLNTWIYIEFQATINNSGSAYLRVNGSPVLSLTGVDTQATANAYANVLRFNSETITTYIDDVYVLDNSGSVNTTFWGDVRVVSVLPSGAGNYSQWTSSTGSANYLNVDENPPNTTDYNSSLTPGQKDTYTFADLTTTDGTVKAVQANIYANKSDAGTRQISGLVRSSGSDYDGATIDLASSFAYYQDIRETDPATGISWTIAGVNGAEFGVDEIA